MFNEVKQELMKMQKIRNYINEALKNAPQGNLRCAVNKGCIQYYCGTQYLGKADRNVATQIAQRDYYRSISSKMDNYIQALEALLTLHERREMEETYRRLSPGRKALVKPIIAPREDIIREFEQMAYQGKAFDERDVTEYYTIKGERVRSKSEKIIADELYHMGIPYKYEMPMQLEYRGKEVTIYPDFTALNKSTGKKWILEHLGMMDRESYYENAMSKLDLYERNGWLQGKNLILLHESSAYPLNTSVVKAYIEEHLC